MKIGEVWKVDLVDTEGHEQTGTRPAIVMAVHNQSHLSVIVPMTRTMRYLDMFPNTYIIPKSRQNGLRNDSIALIFQVRALDFRRFIEKWGDLEANFFTRIKIMLKQYLNL